MARLPPTLQQAACQTKTKDNMTEQKETNIPGLEEAALEHLKFAPEYDIQEELDEGNDPTEIACYSVDTAKDLFIAGAKWMAGQNQQPTVVYGMANIGCIQDAKPVDESRLNGKAQEYLDTLPYVDDCDYTESVEEAYKAGYRQALIDLKG